MGGSLYTVEVDRQTTPPVGFGIKLRASEAGDAVVSGFTEGNTRAQDAGVLVGSVVVGVGGTNVRGRKEAGVVEALRAAGDAPSVAFQLHKLENSSPRERSLRRLGQRLTAALPAPPDSLFGEGLPDVVSAVVGFVQTELAPKIGEMQAEHVAVMARRRAEVDARKAMRVEWVAGGCQQAVAEATALVRHQCRTRVVASAAAGSALRGQSLISHLENLCNPRCGQAGPGRHVSSHHCSRAN